MKGNQQCRLGSLPSLRGEVMDANASITPSESAMHIDLFGVQTCDYGDLRVEDAEESELGVASTLLQVGPHDRTWFM
jgi:hypothetical protein